MSGCISVKKSLSARSIQGDTLCARCEANEESINHMFFLMFPDGSSLDFLQDPIEPIYFPFFVVIRKYGLRVFKAYPAPGRPSICMDFMVFLERTKQQGFQ